MSPTAIENRRFSKVQQWVPSTNVHSHTGQMFPSHANKCSLSLRKMSVHHYYNYPTPDFTFTHPPPINPYIVCEHLSICHRITVARDNTNEKE